MATTDVRTPGLARNRLLSPSARSVGLKLLSLAPAALIIILALLWPIGTVLLRSLNPDGLATLSSGFTLEHYRTLATSLVLRLITIETLQLATYSTVITTLLAIPTAYLMSRLPRRSALILVAMVTLPFWVSILIRLFAFTVILGRQGLINNLLGQFGLGPFDLLFNTPATVIGMVAYLLPYMILVLYSSMGNIDTSLMTAASTMGATRAQAFVHIYLPQLRPALISSAVLVFILGMSFFLTPAILGGPTNLTLPVYIQQKIGNYEWGTASAAGIALLIISIIGCMVAIKIGGANVISGGGHAVGRGVVGQEPIHFNLGTVITTILTACVLMLLLVPILIVIPVSFGTKSLIEFPPTGFTLNWYAEVLTDPRWVNAFWKSVHVGLGTMVLSVSAALGLARANSKIRSKYGRVLIQLVVFSPLIAPSILLAIGIYDVQLQLRSVGTIWGLVVGHSVLAFPLAFIVISNAMSKLDGSLEPAAWSMGASQMRAFWTIIIPSLTSALVSASVIAFMTSFDEVVVALFQTGLHKTLPVQIFSLVESGVTPAVAAVAVMLVTPVLLVVMVSLIIGLYRERKARP